MVSKVIKTKFFTFKINFINEIRLNDPADSTSILYANNLDEMHISFHFTKIIRSSAYKICEIFA